MCDVVTKWDPYETMRVSWISMDKNGRVAKFINNYRGCIPSILLVFKDVEKCLDLLNEYLYEESEVGTKYPLPKEGELMLDIFSTEPFNYLTRQPSYKEVSKKNVLQVIESKIMGDSLISNYSLPSIKGVFIYEALYSYSGEKDEPIGYDGNYKEGDYYRFLMPTVYGSIEDLPEELRRIVVISDTLDFTKDRFITSEMIDIHFTRMYEG